MGTLLATHEPDKKLSRYRTVGETDEPAFPCRVETGIQNCLLRTTHQISVLQEHRRYSWQGLVEDVRGKGTASHQLQRFAHGGGIQPILLTDVSTLWVSVGIHGAGGRARSVVFVARVIVVAVVVG